MSERPYPEGIAWDEAWRQRQRADAAEQECARLNDRLTEIEQEYVELCWEASSWRTSARKLASEAGWENSDYLQPAEETLRQEALDELAEEEIRREMVD